MGEIGSLEEVKLERDRLYHQNKFLEAGMKTLRARNDWLEKIHQRTGELSGFWHGKFLILRNENNKLRHELWQRKARKEAGCASRR